MLSAEWHLKCVRIMKESLEEISVSEWLHRRLWTKYSSLNRVQATVFGLSLSSLIKALGKTM